MNQYLENNQVTIDGEIFSTLTFNHEVFGEKFYTFKLKSPRYSMVDDYIPVLVSERLLDVTKEYVGSCIRIIGQYRSYNMHVGEKNKLVLLVSAKTISLIQEKQEIKSIV